MLTKIVLYFDTMMVYFVFEPALHLLQRITKRDNFWWAQTFIMSANIALTVVALLLIIQGKLAGVAVIVLFINLFIFVATSQKIWKFVMQINNSAYKRHRLQKECARGRYFAINGKENPAMLNLRSARLRRWIEMIMFVIFALLADKFSLSDLKVFCLFALGYTVAMMIWLYMRSCTPLYVTTKQKNNVYSVLFL